MSNENLIEEILHDWAYRCNKGYPDFKCNEDIRILRNLLFEREWPSKAIDSFVRAITEDSEYLEQRFSGLNPHTIHSVAPFLEKVPEDGVEKVTALLKKMYEDGTTKLPPSGQASFARFINDLDEREIPEFIHLIYSKPPIEDMSPIPTSGLERHLADLDAKGIGPVEIYLMVVRPNAYVQGGSESYDIEDGGKYEIKDYRFKRLPSGKEAPDTQGIRLGTFGSVTDTIFYPKMMAVARLIEQTSYDMLEPHVGDEFKELFMAVKEANPKLAKGEISTSRMNLYLNFYEQMNKLVDSDIEDYTYATFVSPKNPKKSYEIAPIDPADFDDGEITVDLKTQAEKDTFEELIRSYRELDYIKNPEQLKTDIKTSVDNIYKHYMGGESGIKFVVFRANKIIVASGFEFERVTGGGVKVKEVT